MATHRQTFWVFIRSESNRYTVGFYTPTGQWMTEGDYDSKEEAADRVHYLNGAEAPCPTK